MMTRAVAAAAMKMEVSRVQESYLDPVTVFSDGSAMDPVIGTSGFKIPRTILI